MCLCGIIADMEELRSRVVLLDNRHLDIVIQVCLYNVLTCTVTDCVAVSCHNLLSL